MPVGYYKQKAEDDMMALSKKRLKNIENCCPLAYAPVNALTEKAKLFQ